MAKKNDGGWWPITMVDGEWWVTNGGWSMVMVDGGVVMMVGASIIMNSWPMVKW
jgi:hypothetical protein